MRVPTLAATVLVLVLVAYPVAAEDFGDVGKVNRLIGVIETPQLAPGESGVFRFEFNLTYTEPIENTTLRAEIYGYATIEEAIPVDSNWSYLYPRIAEALGANPREVVWDLGTVAAGSSGSLNFTVLTAADADAMPHGTVFSQATYFVRFRLDFNGTVGGVRTAFVMKSLGHFAPGAWEAATNATNTTPCSPPWCRANVNLTMLGVDGILPDSSFGVKEPIPIWPFYALVVGAAFFLVLAFLFWVEENPGTYPRIDAWWARTRGRLVRLRPVRRRAPRT